MNIKLKIRVILEMLTGYWFYKIRYLPLGVDLRIDLQKRLKYKNVKNIFDVGANIGQSHYLFRNYFPNSSIYCFEPINITFDKLKHNLKEAKNTILENFAFGEVPEKKQVRLFKEWDVLNSLNEKLMNNEPNAEYQDVNIDTIDIYCKMKNVQQIDILKIDTEGYEIKVLKGADELLRKKAISFILCEVGFLKKNFRNSNFSELCEFFASYDYYFICLYPGGMEFWDKGLSYGNALFGHRALNS